MIKKSIQNKNIKAYAGIFLLAAIIGFLVYVGLRSLNTALALPIDNGDQRDLSFFVSLYYSISVVMLIAVIPLCIMLVTQVALLFKPVK